MVTCTLNVERGQVHADVVLVLEETVREVGGHETVTVVHRVLRYDVTLQSVPHRCLVVTSFRGVRFAAALSLLVFSAVLYRLDLVQIPAVCSLQTSSIARKKKKKKRKKKKKKKKTWAALSANTFWDIKR